MIKVALTQDKMTLIDNDDCATVSKYRWYANKRSSGIWYAQRNASVDNPYTLLHRYLLAAPKGYEVDHIDGDGLNNQRGNLRIVTVTENQWNRYRARNIYKGVTQSGKIEKKWRARITVNKKEIFIGNFHTSREAALAYNEAAIKYFGQYANLNNI